jgi:hypothetical protein
MSELILVSSDEQSLKPLVEGALANEARLLQAGIRRTERQLHEYERRFEMPTSEFVDRFEADELDETLELDEWIGEYRLLQRLREKLETLRGIEFAN